MFRPFVTCVLLSLTVCESGLAENVRFSGRTRNGDRVSNGELVEWHDENAQPKLDGRALLDPNNPYHWILDENSPPPPSPRAYVEFVGGDRLPGLVVGGGTDSAFDRRFDHVLVEPTVPLDDPDTGRTTRVRVFTRWMRRIVWDSPAPRRIRPGTLFHRDGRETAFRTLRWSDDVVLLLTPGGLETVPLRDVSEIHFPAQDDWEAYFDELATLDPDGDATLMRWETRDGLVVTSSTRRFAPESRGDRRRHENWEHVVQPTWSLDPFWVRFGSVRSVRFWKANEIPLSRIAPADVRRESVFGSSWNWRADASSQGTTLRSGGHPYGWGFGVHARTELHFDVPAFAESFESGVGLDSLVGSGGSVQASVHVGADLKQRLNHSPLLTGAANVHRTGAIGLPKSSDGPTRLVLVADMARGAEPAGGDPFDVRDVCDWLDPVVRLRREDLVAAVRARAEFGLPGLDGWTAAGISPLRLRSDWDRSDARDPRFVPSVTIDGPFESWSRTVRTQVDSRWLAMAVHRIGNENDPKTTVQVRLNGKTVGEFDVPRWSDEWGPNPVLIPVAAELRGREIEVQLDVLPEKPGESFVRWQGVEFVSHPPHLIRVFDEEIDFPRELREGRGTAMVTFEDSKRGVASLVVTPPNRGRVEFEGLRADVRERPRVGEFRYLRFSWWKRDGAQIGLAIGHDGEFGTGDEVDVRPRIIREHSAGFQTRRYQTRDQRGLEVGYRYDSSNAAPEERRALRLERKPPREWRTWTRDLFADFGEFTLTGFDFEAVDGEAAYFDEIYLARRGGDFAELDRPGPPALPPEFAFWETDPARYHLPLGEVAPGFATPSIGDGAILDHEFRGRRRVVRIHGPDNRATVLRRPFVVPKKGARLLAEVSHNPGQPWKLVVQVGEDTIHEQVVDDALTEKSEGWKRIEVDLSRFREKPIVVDVRCEAQGGRRGHAFWKSLRIE